MVDQSSLRTPETQVVARHKTTAVFSVMERTGRDNDDVRSGDEDQTDDDYEPEAETTSTGESSPFVRTQPFEAGPTEGVR